jgi:cell pole-organizing protein PopZ
MSDPTAQEPTMEEILASIRRIISEDDAPASEPPAAETPSVPAPEPHEEPALTAAPAPPRLAAVPPPPPAPAMEEDEDEVLDLTEPAPAPKETHGDLDVFDAPPPPKAPEPKPEPIKAPPIVEPSPMPSFGAFEEDRLISGGTEDKAASHFGKLSQSIAMPSGGRTLEDLVSELLKPLLKDWLDEHLPAIVEEKVQSEVERISRRRP